MGTEAASPSGAPEASDGSIRDGGDRIFQFLRYMFARHDPGEKARFLKPY